MFSTPLPPPPQKKTWMRKENFPVRFFKNVIIVGQYGPVYILQASILNRPPTQFLKLVSYKHTLDDSCYTQALLQRVWILAIGPVFTAETRA